MPLAAGLLFVGLLAWSQAAAADYAGYVLEVSGHWSTDGAPQRELSAGYPVEQGARIHRRPPFRSTDSMVIFGRNGQEIAKRSCTREAVCRTPILLPTAPGRDGPPVRLVGAVMQRWRSEEARFTTVSGRGGRLRLYEGVVALSPDGADLTAVAGDLPAGTYTLVWRPIAAATPGAALRRSQFERRAEAAAAMAAISDLQPGLCQLVACAGAPAADAERDCEAWVLALPEAAYPDAAVSFRSAVGLAATWAADTTGDTTRKFLRAVARRCPRLRPARSPAPGAWSWSAIPASSSRW